VTLAGEPGVNIEGVQMGENTIIAEPPLPPPPGDTDKTVATFIWKTARVERFHDIPIKVALNTDASRNSPNWSEIVKKLETGTKIILPTLQ
jgi:hypothetical protein